MQGIFNNGWEQVIVILLGILVGVLFNNVRLTDLRSHVDKRIDDLDRSLSKRIDDLGKRTDGLDTSLIKRMDGLEMSLRDFIRSEIKRLEDRIARLEHPIFKP